MSDNREKEIKVSVHDFDPTDWRAQCSAGLVWLAMQNGLTEVGESLMIMVPEMEIGESREAAKPSGQWTITIEKTGD